MSAATKTEAKRTIERVEADRDAVQDALVRLYADRTEHEARLASLFEDEDGTLEQAALSGKPSGTGSELAKIRTRLDVLPALSHALRRRLLRLQIELTELWTKEAEKQRIAAIAALDAALSDKIAADDAHKMAAGAAGDASWRSRDLQTGRASLVQALEKHEEARPGPIAPPKPPEEETVESAFAAALERARLETAGEVGGRRG